MNRIIQIVKLIYLPLSIELSEILLKRKVEISEATGFANEKLKYSNLNLLLWFLTSKNRHLWRHHYLGTQGIIFVFSSKSKNFADREKLIVETMNTFKDLNLIGIPFLILLDKNDNPGDEEIERANKLKSQIIEGKFLFNTLFLNFDEKNALEEVYYGMDWLCSEMKPLK